MVAGEAMTAVGADLAVVIYLGFGGLGGYDSAGHTTL
jgi:hypothetical protein